MILYPAIDLLQGQAVRLYQGDYDRKTVYEADPLAAVLRFEQAGATHLHLVDLDGARSGEAVNREAILRIAAASRMSIQVGGGIRDMERVEGYLAHGVQRVILGTAAVEDKEFLQDALQAWPGRVAVGVDVRDGLVATKGWLHDTQLPLTPFLQELGAMGVQALIVTDIHRDGAMQGPNAALYRQIGEAGAFDLIASGGVSSLADLQVLRQLGLHGAIIGKALYTGAIDLKAALEESK